MGEGVTFYIKCGKMSKRTADDADLCADPQSGIVPQRPEIPTSELHNQSGNATVATAKGSISDTIQQVLEKTRQCNFEPYVDERGKTRIMCCYEVRKVGGCGGWRKIGGRVAPSIGNLVEWKFDFNHSENYQEIGGQKYITLSAVRKAKHTAKMRTLDGRPTAC